MDKKTSEDFDYELLKILKDENIDIKKVIDSINKEADDIALEKKPAASYDDIFKS
jgi:hypothetical protein